MPIKFFRDFSLEKEIYNIVYTPDNFNDWLLINPGKDTSEFGKQIHNSLIQLSNVPDKTVISQASLDEYLSNFNVYKNDKLRSKVIKLILREYKPNDIFKQKDKPFDWTEFKHSKVEDGDTWTYKDITIIKPNSWDSFSKLDEINMPDNLNMRRKHNYKDFYGDKGFELYTKTYGIAFYFVNYGSSGSEYDDAGKTLLFMVIPHQINFDLVPRIKYNSILLKHNSYTDVMYVMGENKPDIEEVDKLVTKYDLDHILLPIPIEEDNIIKRILKFRFK